MQSGRIQAGARQPGAQGELAMAEDAGGGTKADSLSQSAEDFGDTLGRGLEPIQDGAGAHTKLRVARRATKTRSVNTFVAAMVAAADQGVDLVISDPEVEAVGIWAGIAGGGDAFL